MPDDGHADITTLLGDVRAGKPDALNQLLGRVYDELRARAAWHLHRERSDPTLQPTVIVHEVFLKLFQPDVLAKMPNRAYLFACAARNMRQFLVDHARERGARKRGGDRRREEWDSSVVVANSRKVDVVKLHEALTNLSLVNDRQAQVVELRFFAGMSNQEIADYLHVSLSAVERDWRFARAWLREHLDGMA